MVPYAKSDMEVYNHLNKYSFSRELLQIFLLTGRTTKILAHRTTGYHAIYTTAQRRASLQQYEEYGGY